MSAIAPCDCSVVATTVAVAPVTRANTNAEKIKNFRMTTPVLLSVYAKQFEWGCDRDHRIVEGGVLLGRQTLFDRMTANEERCKWGQMPLKHS
jgi:hypothetical protein